MRELWRSGHAVRSLAEADTRQRRRELSNALAYWAAGYQALPEAASTQRLGIDEAVKQLPLLPDELLGLRGWETRVAALPAFASAIDFVDFGEPAQSLSMITRVFAHLYLANAGLPHRVIIPIHAVTSAAAVRTDAGPAGHQIIVSMPMQSGYASRSALPEFQQAERAEQVKQQPRSLSMPPVEQDAALSFPSERQRERYWQPRAASAIPQGTRSGMYPGSRLRGPFDQTYPRPFPGGGLP